MRVCYRTWRLVHRLDQLRFTGIYGSDTCRGSASAVGSLGQAEDLVQVSEVGLLYNVVVMVTGCMEHATIAKENYLRRVAVGRLLPHLPVVQLLVVHSSVQLTHAIGKLSHQLIQLLLLLPDLSLILGGVCTSSIGF